MIGLNKWIRKLLWCLSLAASARLICVPVGAWQEGPQEGNKMMRQSAVPASVIEGEIASCSASVAVGNPLLCLEAEELEGLTLTPGGMPFGVRFLTDGVTVVGFCDFEAGGKKVNPAAAAGLKLRDTILRVNGEPLTGASALTEKIEHCGGRELILLCRRGASEMELRLKPVWCEAEQRYKTGIWVRDSGAGIGTVTFIIPETGAFAGLGHGICDADSGELIAMRRGTVSDVTISSVVRGAVGAPGELKGYFNPGKTGALLGNSACGVWGVFSDPPESTADALPVGLRGGGKRGDLLHAGQQPHRAVSGGNFEYRPHGDRLQMFQREDHRPGTDRGIGRNRAGNVRFSDCSERQAGRRRDARSYQ